MLSLVLVLGPMAESLKMYFVLTNSGLRIQKTFWLWPKNFKDSLVQFGRAGSVVLVSFPGLGLV